MHPDLISRPEAAKLLGVTTKTLDRWVAAARLRKIQVVPNGRVHFRRADVEALLQPRPADEEPHAA
jgi:excisionase family DNA binding protein